MKEHCVYCGSSRHKRENCRIGKFGRGEIDTLSYGVEIDASKSIEILFKAIEIIHADKNKKDNHANL